MKTIDIDLPTNGYPVYLGRGLLSAEALWAKHLGDGKVLVVSNETVAPLYLERLLEALGEPIMSSTLTLPGDDWPLSDPVDIEERIGHDIDVIAEAGPTGIEPTSVLDLSGGTVEVLRAARGDVSQFT